MTKSGLVVIFVIGLSCGVRKSTISDNEKILGRWQNEEDTLWHIGFDGQKVMDYYDSKLVDENYYRIKSYPCDLNYKQPEAEDLFLEYFNDNNESNCYEIAGLNGCRLSYIYTQNGKIFTFKKVN